MTSLQMAVCALISLNSVIFILGTKAVFRSDRAKIQSYCFMVAFGLILAASLWGLYRHTTFSPVKLGFSCAMGIISLVIFVWASKTIRSTPFTIIFSPDTPEFLIQSGPYRFVRHPFYTSYLINFFASSLSCDHLLAATATSAAILSIYAFAAKQEEAKFDASALHLEYTSYRKITGMFFPKTFKIGK